MRELEKAGVDRLFLPADSSDPIKSVESVAIMADFFYNAVEFVYDLWIKTPVTSLIMSNFLLIAVVFCSLRLIKDKYHGFPRRLLEEATLAAAIVLFVQVNKPLCTAWGYVGVFLTCCYSKLVVAHLTPDNTPGPRSATPNASGSAAGPIKECLSGDLKPKKLMKILGAQTIATIMALAFDATIIASGDICAFHPNATFIQMAAFEVLASLMLITLNESPSRLKDEVVLTMYGLLGVTRVCVIGIGGINLSVYVRNLLMCPDADSTMAAFAIIPLITAFGAFCVERWSAPEGREAVLPR